MKKTLFITQAAVIAAMYVALVFVTNMLPGYLNYGMVQFRLSEALSILPVFTPAAVPGLFLGCLFSNFLSPVGLPDIIIGSLATLAAASLTYVFRKQKWFAPIPAVVINAVAIGIMLFIFYPVPEGNVSLISYMIAVGAGEAVVCCGLGYPLIALLSRSKRRIY